MTLCCSQTFLLVLCFFGAMIYIIEAAAYPAGSIEERQATANPTCAYYSDNYGSHSAYCRRLDLTCQLAIALTPAVLFCGTLGQTPITSLEDYKPSCEEGSSCCGSASPSVGKLEFNNGDTVWYGCGIYGGIFTAEADENIITLPRSTTATSTTENAQTSFAAASPSPTISSPKSSGASPAKTSAASHVGSNSSGLSTASEVGSVLGAICGAIAIVVAIFYGTRTLKKRRHDSLKRQSSELGGQYIALNFFHTNSGAGVS